MVYLRLRPKTIPTLSKPDPPIVFRTFTPLSLLENDGTKGKPIYFAVRGRVFDVTPGKNFYGPGGPYSTFAGHDASRGLALGSFDSVHLTKDLEGPLDKLDDLTDYQKEALGDWESKFLAKYLTVGKLVSVADEAKEK
jgi:membrane-associated progesterone receptor component